MAYALHDVAAPFDTEPAYLGNRPVWARGIRLPIFSWRQSLRSSYEALLWLALVVIFARLIELPRLGSRMPRWRAGRVHFRMPYVLSPYACIPMHAVPFESHSHAHAIILTLLSYIALAAGPGCMFSFALERALDIDAIAPCSIIHLSTVFLTTIRPMFPQYRRPRFLRLRVVVWVRACIWTTSLSPYNLLPGQRPTICMLCAVE